MVNFKKFNHLKSIMTNLSNSDKGSIVFIIILTILLGYVAHYKIYEQWGLNSTITMFAVIVAMGTGLISQLHNRDSLKTARETLETSKELNKKTLEQTEKNLQLQLMYNDQKKALLTLHKILQSKNDIKNAKEYLNSPESFFLPSETRNLVIKLIAEVDLMKANAPGNSPMTSEMIDDIQEEAEKAEQQYYESLDVIDQFQHDLDKKVSELKTQLNHNILSSLGKS